MSPLDQLYAPSEDEMLQTTQKVRLGIIRDMTSEGMPDNNRDRRVLLELMNGADTTAMAMKKLQSDENLAGQDNKVAQMAVAVLGKLAEQGANPFEQTIPEGTTVEHDTLPDGLLDDPNTVAGEMDIGVADLSYDEFMASQDSEDTSD